MLEDAEQYDISLILGSGVIENDLRKKSNKKCLVSKIIPAYGKYVKTYCEGSLNSKGELELNLSGVCEDSQISVLDETLTYSMLIGICKVIFVRAVVPFETPLRLIKTFADFVRICIFPFINFVNEADNLSQKSITGSVISQNASNQITQNEQLQ